MLSANFVLQVIRDGDLKKMSGNSFMSQDRPGIFNRRADVEILRLRIVGGNQIETGRVFIVKAGRIHETAWTRWLERLRQLSNLKLPEVFRQPNELPIFQELDHLRFAIFVSFQER